MCDLIFGGHGGGSTGIAPIVFQDELRLGADRELLGFAAHVGSDAVLAPFVEKLFWLSTMRHRQRPIRLGIQVPRDPGDGWLGHKLSDKSYATTFASADIKPEVDFFKIDVSRDFHTQNSRVLEPERDEANQGLALP